MENSSRQKINLGSAELQCTLDQKDLTEIYKTFHLTAKECTLICSAHSTFYKIDHMVTSKMSLLKCKDSQNHIKHPSEHNKIKLEISNKESYRNHEIHRNLTTYP
jgi:hypothetical protein